MGKGRNIEMRFKSAQKTCVSLYLREDFCRGWDTKDQMRQEFKNS